jgi:hypothetical protein
LIFALNPARETWFTVPQKGMQEELSKRQIVTQEIVEKALGAEPGSFDFLN